MKQWTLSGMSIYHEGIVAFTETEFWLKDAGLKAKPWYLAGMWRGFSENETSFENEPET